MIGKNFILVFAMQHWSEVNAATKPNILMFVMDDLGWNDTSYKGSDILTPNILPTRGFVCSDTTFKGYALPRDPL